MNLRQILVAPWRSTQRSLRWLSVIVFAACSVTAVAMGYFLDKPGWWQASAITYGVGVGYCWAFFMPATLLLAIDARQLRMPGVQRTVTWGLLAYGVACVALPTVVLAWLGGNALVVAELVALCLATGLAFALLPRYIAMVISFIPALSIGLKHVIHIPGPSDPRFMVWAAWALAVLLLLDALCWRRLLHAEEPLEQGFNSAMVMQLRRSGTVGVWGCMGHPDSSQMIRRRPDWMQPRADLRHAGPASPVNALKVALGGWYVPQTLGGHLRQLVPVLLPLLLMVPVMTIMQFGEASGHSTLHDVMQGTGVAVIGWLGVFGGVMLMAMTVMVLRQRWARTNAELPLLALLPRLGDGASVRKALLHASLLKPLLALVLLSGLVVVAAISMHLGWLAVMFVLLAQLGCAATMASVAMNIFGGRPLAMWQLGVLMAGVCVLVMLSTFVPLTAQGKHPWEMSGVAEACIAAGWLAVAAVLCRLGRRGWRNLRQRAHPFLAN